MIVIVLLALALLGLPSCQWGLVSPERQPDPLNTEECGAEARLAAVRSEPLSPSSKTARQYVREGYRMLLVGKAQEARRALRAALRQAPQNKQAAMLLQQIEGDPAVRFGLASFPYRIRPNDTLTGLAQRFLDDALQFYTLAKYNNLPNPSRIVAGQIINIPVRPPEPDAAPQAPPEPVVAPPPAVAEPIAPSVAAPPATPVAASPPVIVQTPVSQPDTSPTTAPEAEAEPTVVPTGRTTPW
ncbi:hypothetical protein C2W62_03510 [Candidatus Entotheonella serta]|nr:hypothetical protein C2W62_03510 [Candidatus Entotheonella serta]